MMIESTERRIKSTDDEKMKEEGWSTCCLVLLRSYAILTSLLLKWKMELGTQLRKIMEG
jgi:hypothetical protein